MTDAHEVIQAVSLLCNVSVRTLTTAISVSYFWCQRSTELFFIGFLLSTMQIVIMHCIHPWHQEHTEKSRTIKQKVETTINEYIQQHTPIILYAWQNMYQERHHTLRAPHALAAKQEGISYAIFLIALQLAPRLGEIYMIYALLQTELTTAHLMEIYTYYHLLTESIGNFKDQWIASWKQKTAMQRMTAILEKIPPNDIISHEYMDKPSICFNRITFSYPNSAPVFSHFSLDIDPGEHVMIKAKSGRGKTTLLKLLLGLYSVQSGDIRIGHRNVATMSPTEIRSLISILPQEPFYDRTRTLRENLCLGTNSDLGTILDQVELLKDLDGVFELSGGQKQRVALARVLLQTTPIVILDEPTSALDEETEQKMIHMIQNHIHDKTVIWITHRNFQTAMRVIHL
jgi:ABC-type branched-subunit amino acid transport system ATPase component